jgi:hypothetical protein
MILHILENINSLISPSFELSKTGRCFTSLVFNVASEYSNAKDGVIIAKE